METIRTKAGTITVIKVYKTKPGKSGMYRGVFKCFCGSEFDSLLYHVRHSRISSCGCWRREWGRTHGVKHGKSGSSEYNTWQMIIRRCTKEGSSYYSDYGGRGITVCERWRKFENFLEDMGTRPGPGYSVDRIDNDGNYEPGNCRWATRIQQANNKRSNRTVVVDGKSMSLSEAARYRGVNPKTVYTRIYRGQTPEEALS